MFLRSDTEKRIDGNNPTINTHHQNFNTYSNACSTDISKEDPPHVSPVTEKNQTPDSSILNDSVLDQLSKDVSDIKEGFENLKTTGEPTDEVSRDAKIIDLKKQVENCADLLEKLRNEQASQARTGVINPVHTSKLTEIRGHLALLKLMSAGIKVRPRSSEYKEYGGNNTTANYEYEDNNQSRQSISHEFQLPAAVPDRFSKITKNGTKKFVSITGKQMDRADFNSIMSSEQKNRKNREPMVFSKQKYRTPVSTPDASDSKSYTNIKNKSSVPDFSHTISPISARNRSPDVNSIKSQSLRRQLCTSGFKSDDPKQELTISEYIRQKRSSSNNLNQKSATRTPSIVGPLDINLEQYYSNSQAYMNRFIKSIPENEVVNGLDHYTKYLLYGSNIEPNPTSIPNSVLNSDSDLPIKDIDRIKMDKFSNNVDNFRLIIFTDSGLMFKQVLLDTKTSLKHSNEKDSINRNSYHSQTELSSAMFGSSGLLINNSNSVTKIHFLRSLPNLKSSVLITRLFSLRSDFKSTKVKLDKKNNNTSDKDIHALNKPFRDLQIPNTRKNSQLSDTEDWNPNSTISLDDNPISDNSNVEITRYAIGVVVPLSTTCTSENISIETVQDLIGNNWNEIENNFASLEMALTEKLRQSRFSIDSSPPTPSPVGIADVLSSNHYFNMSTQDNNSSPTNNHLKRPEFNPNREYDESKFLMNVDESQSSFNRLRRDSNLFDCFNELVASLIYLTESPRLYINLQSNASIISWASTLSAWLEFKDIKPKNSTLKYNRVGTKVPVIMDADSGFRFISLLIAILLPLRKDLFQSKPMDRTSNVTRRFVIATGNPIVSQKLIFILVGLLGYDSYEFICGDESEYIDSNSKDQRNATVLGSSSEKVALENKGHHIQLTSAASTRPSSPVDGFHTTHSSRSSSNGTIPIARDSINNKNEPLYESSSPSYVGAIPIYSNNAGVLGSRKMSPPSGPTSDIAGSYGSISSLSHEGWGIPTKSTASISSSPVAKRSSYLSESYFEQQHHQQNHQLGNNHYQEIPLPRPHASLPLEPVQDCDTFETCVYPEMIRDPIKRTSSLASLQNISSSYGGAKPIAIKNDQGHHQNNDNSWSNPSSYLSRHSFSAGLSSLFDRLKGGSISTIATGSVNSDNGKIHNSASTVGLSQSLTGSSFNGKYSPGKIDLKGVNTYSNRLKIQRQGSDNAFRSDFPSPLAEYKQSPLDRATNSFNSESSRNIFRTLEYLPNMNRDAYSLTKVEKQNSEKDPVTENMISKKLISNIMNSTQKINYYLNEKSNSIIADVSISAILSSKLALHDTKKAVLPNVCGYIKQLRPEYSFMATSFEATSSKICDRIIEDDLKKTYLNLNESEINENGDNKIYSQIICVSLATRGVYFYEGSVAITPSICGLSSENGNRDLNNTSSEVGETDITTDTNTPSTLTQAIRSSSASLYNNIMSSGTETRRKYEGCESNGFDPKMIKSRKKIIFSVKRKLIDNSQGVHKYDIKYDNQIVGRVDKLLSEIVDVTYRLEKATSIRKNATTSGIRKPLSPYGKSNSYLGNGDSFPSIYEDTDYFSSKLRNNSNSTVQEEDVSSVYDKDHNGYGSDNDTIYNYDPSTFTEEEAVAEIKRLIKEILSLAGDI
ncbi:hypothetical protein BVG19_g3832 [[Candida] boidinii]|nr:hypothetical protein BVG19_g3832 [[Candida] boidinii]OWB52241.1 hypothetical protein B5S27_g3813 [[Candida] boidinii]